MTFWLVWSSWRGKWNWPWTPPLQTPPTQQGDSWPLLPEVCRKPQSRSHRGCHAFIRTFPTDFDHIREDFSLALCFEAHYTLSSRLTDVTSSERQPIGIFMDIQNPICGTWGRTSCLAYPLFYICLAEFILLTYFYFFKPYNFWIWWLLKYRANA